MPTLNVKGAELNYELDGDGAPLVLVHGNWSDRTSWGLLTPHLVREFRVLSYDRRGYGRGATTAHRTPRRRNEDDLAALIEAVCGEPAHVVGNSYGGLTALGLASRRPDLVRTLSVHEPPAVSLPGGHEFAERMEGVMATLETVRAEIEDGDLERAARRFMEEGVLGAGAWALFPHELRALFVRTAPAFAAEVRAARWSELDLEALRGFAQPVLLTKGEVSPDWLPAILDRLAELLPEAETSTVRGAGHGPHQTHPEEYARVVAEFVGRAETEGLAAAA